jgi:hypothetical protein
MSQFNYDGKSFVGIENYDIGDLTKNIVFRYHQRDDVVWSVFEGGRVLHGHTLARLLDDGRLDMVWQYLNVDGRFVTGTCMSTPEMLPDGRYRLHEAWTISGAPPVGESGSSVIEETPDPDYSV